MCRVLKPGRVPVMTNELRSQIKGRTRVQSQAPDRRTLLLGGAGLAGLALLGLALVFLTHPAGGLKDANLPRHAGLDTAFRLPDLAASPETASLAPVATPSPQDIQLGDGETNPFPAMRGAYVPPRVLDGQVEARALGLFDTGRFAELEALHAIASAPAARNALGEPLAPAFFQGFLDADAVRAGYLPKRLRLATRYRAAYPQSPAPTMIEASLLASRLLAIRSDNRGALRRATRPLIDYLETHRDTLRSQSFSHVLWIAMLAKTGETASIQTELDAATRASADDTAALRQALLHVGAQLPDQPDLLGDLGGKALMLPPEADQALAYARMNLELAAHYPRRLYSDTRLNRDAFHAGLMDLLSRYPSPASFERAAQVACANNDRYLAKMLVQRMQVLPEQTYAWDPEQGFTPYSACRRQIASTYGTRAPRP
jgi:hypothetical protein